jgi:UDP-N-acetylmuramate dehydrogenase
VPTDAAWDDLLRTIAGLPAEDVSVQSDEPMSAHTTLRIGGPARCLATCRSSAGVAGMVRAAQDTGVPWLVLGQGANVLVPDEGLDAVVLHLDGALADVEVDAATVTAGGGAPLARLVRATIDAGLAGLEYLGGIPSTVGGALAMNAGAHGQEILDVLAWAEVVEANGAIRRLARDEVEWGYRWSSLGRDRIVTRAELHLQPVDGATLRERARDARERRLAALPAEPSAGSVFRNPPGDFAGRLLEQAGCKGLQSGAALVSAKHANVIVNPGGARAADVRALIREMARRVREHSGIRLILELKVLERDGTVLTDAEAV